MNYAEDEDDEGLDDSEMPDPTDASDDDSVDTTPCPECHRAVYEHADVCPYCGCYLSRANRPAHNPRWIILTALATLAAIAFFWLTRGR